MVIGKCFGEKCSRLVGIRVENIAGRGRANRRQFCCSQKIKTLKHNIYRTIYIKLNINWTVNLYLIF
jgi:hypothetical protein